MMTYEEAYEAHTYLWRTYGAAADMTGAYVDQDDLAQLLKSPTKATAKRCLENQIRHWFNAGTDNGMPCWRGDETVEDIADALGITPLPA
jgi:hypothetical protein